MDIVYPFSIIIISATYIYLFELRDLLSWNAWSCFEAVKPAPWKSRWLRRCCRFLEPSNDIADPGCCYFFPRCHFWAHQEWELDFFYHCNRKVMRSSVLTLSTSQISRQRVVPRSNKNSNCIFLEGIVLSFYLLDSLHSITNCFL